MDEKLLNFDRTKHVLYSEKIKQIVLSRLQKRHKEEDVNPTFEKIQLQYLEFLKDLPYLGGPNCIHNGPGGTYDCIFIFAYYVVENREPTIEEIYKMNNEAFLPAYYRLSKIANLNKRWQRKVMSKIFQITSKRDIKLESTCPTGYVMRVKPYDKETGIHYTFSRCPIAEFAKAHDLLEIMPAFCNGDYPAIELLNGKLIREHTCSNSNICDYWIVGNESKFVIENPEIVDEQGYIKNIIKH